MFPSCMQTDLDVSEHPDWTAPSAAGLLVLGAGLGDEESLEEEELQVPGGDDEEAESHRPPADVLRVGLQQEVVSALPHAAEVVVAEHVEDVVLHFVTRILQQHNTNLNTLLLLPKILQASLLLSLSLQILLLLLPLLLYYQYIYMLLLLLHSLLQLLLQGYCTVYSHSK